MTTQIIIFIIVMLGYGVAFVFKKLQEQAELKRAREQRERRRLEALRTGRMEEDDAPNVIVATGSGSPGPTSHQEAARRLQEIAERRRQQLEELRRRAMGQGAPTPPLTLPTSPASPSAPARRTQTSGPVPRQPQRPAQRPVQRPAAPTPRQAPPAPPARRSAIPSAGHPSQARTAPGRADAAPLNRRQSPARSRETERRAPAATGVPVAPLLPSVAEPVTRAAAGGIAGLGALFPGKGKPTAAEWRRAILLREVLAPPVSMRGEDRDTF